MKTSQTFRLSPIALAVAGGLASTGYIIAEAAEPAQIPLSSRVAEPPPPNVMVTIDDSGSMLADFMPEGTFTLNGKSVTLNTQWVGGFPNDARKLDGSKVPANYEEGVVTSEKHAKVTDDVIYQMQFRSSDVNAIWYSPDKVYLPWYKTDGSGRMPSVTDATKARWDPYVSTATTDLKTKVSLKTRWYSKPSTYADDTRDFYPGLYYRLKTVTSDPTNVANYVRYDVNATDGSHAPATKHPNRTDCAGAKCTQAEELKNFSNWFTYHRMRESLTKAAVGESLVAFKDKLRVGWGRINKASSDVDGVSYAVVNTGVRQLDATQLDKVLKGVYDIRSWPSTPLRWALDQVGQYFDEGAVGGRSSKGSPWLMDPTVPTSKRLDCRRSVNLLMTDGYYNDDKLMGTGSGQVTAGDSDISAGPDYSKDADNPLKAARTQYTPERPFIDKPGVFSNTLADFSMKYFKKDLDSKSENRVPPVLGDIAYWQHLTQFTVGLGVKGTLDSSNKLLTVKKLTDGVLTWPNPTAGNPEKIDDMWHAALNTGGDFYSVKDSTELTDALKDAFGKAAGNEAKEAGVATASATLIAGNVKYVPKYKAVDWYGDLEAWGLNSKGVQNQNPDWRASELLTKKIQDGTHLARNLYTWNATDKKAVKFLYAEMGDVNKALIGSETLTNYIRGDDTILNADQTDKLYRNRASKFLGDFVNSPPVVVRNQVSLGYTSIESSYTAYLAQKNARADSAIFLGGNDGMLHAFKGKTGDEIFGFVPKAALKGLATISQKTYGTAGNYHKFFVDGPVNETDAFIKAPGASSAAWTNVVIGAMGAGGKSVFAVHVPTADPTALDSNAPMWEINGADDNDMGYIFADFAVGKVKGAGTSGWYAFVGNGIYSKSGNAVLLMIDLTDGHIEKRITVDSSGGTGLMGVSLVKDADQQVVAAYAGDLKGQVWRFDFEGPSSSEWKVGFKGKPFFVAADKSHVAQPIVAAPVFANHSSGGHIVLFGTGRLIDSADSDNTSSQTYYGVWDPTKEGSSSALTDSPFTTVAFDRDVLQAQIIHTDAVLNEGGTGSYYKIDSTPVNWEKQFGWFADLPFAGQRVIYPSAVLGKDYVLFSTMVPATKAETCRSNSGTGYNYILAAQDGTQVTEPIFDTDGDGVVNEKDLVVAGYGTGSDGRDAIVSDPDQPLIGGDSSGGKGQICDTSSECKNIELPCLTNCTAPTITDRIWQQILTPPKPKE